MSAICQPSLSPLVARLSQPAANESGPMRLFRVRINSAALCLSFDAMSEDSMSCVIQHMGLADSLGGALSVKAVQ